MTNFTYDELQKYSDLVNEVKDLTNNLQHAMAGCFIDSSAEGDMRMAKVYADRLAEYSSALRIEIGRLHDEAKPTCCDGTGWTGDPHERCTEHYQPLDSIWFS